MCGIAGIVHPDSGRTVEPSQIEAMCSVMQHRGPDDQGIYCDGPVGIGMRRLAIIDLSSGQQPIANEDQTVWIVFNGEVYNFQEKRALLEGKGHQFRTNADTEVIVHLYEEFGLDFVDHLRGMFAIAIWDCSKKRCVLVRDRLGIKPLYYRVADGILQFGSELKTLLACPDVPRSIDDAALREFLVFQYVPNPMTIFEGIRQLQPGHLLVWEDGHESISEYWRLKIEPTPQPFDQATEKFDELLAESVKLRLIADVPLGVFLSGGLDSGSVVATMARVSDEPIKTFSIGFEDERLNELPDARHVAEMYGTDHHERIVKSDALGLLPKLMWHYDEPFADDSAIPTYYVSQAAREHVTVALSGDGGDEMLIGYARYPKYHKLRWILGLPAPLRALLWGPASKAIPNGVRGAGFLKMLRNGMRDGYMDGMSIYTSDTLGDIMSDPSIGEKLAAVGESFRAHWTRSEGLPVTGRLQHIDANTYLPDCMLTKVDRASMANSLEVRVPLLDHVLAEFLATLPIDYKFRDGKGKQILRQIMEPRLPPGHLNRQKRGFGTPIDRWFQNELKELLSDTLLDSRATQRGIFRRDAIERMIAEQGGIGRRNHSRRLWALLTFELWHRVVLEGDM